MKMILVRKVFAKDMTLGELHLEKGGYFCDTMEPHSIDWSKEKKKKGKTAIPEGRYKVSIGWSKKWQRDVPWLCRVPHFTGIQIHIGNFPKDTQGCILVGDADKDVLINSRRVFDALMKKLKGEKGIEIEVRAHPQEAHPQEAHPQPLPGEGGTPPADETEGVGKQDTFDPILEKFL